MLLDRTRLAIRERDLFDLADMALRVVREHAAALLLAWSLGALPFLALNVSLLGHGDPLRANIESDEERPVPAEDFFVAAILTLWEMPLATSLITLYLGQAMFNQRPQPRQIARSLLGSLPQLIVYQVLLRGVLVWFFITWIVLFSSWSHLNEIILLERNPMFGGPNKLMTTSRRVSSMHSGIWGDIFGRSLMSGVVGGLLLAAVFGSTVLACGTLLGNWGLSSFSLFVVFQLSLWLVVGYFAVVRFLSYLDLRIRREGWEVELLVRAEEAQLRRQWA